jgi:bifunctional UDP-N-acetylglucosamine pyrophosphorylase/glucosamine-1-phosphate N-acetyltransferase
VNSLEVIILAAGQGTRMRSALPKVMHKLAGKPLVKHVIDTALSIGAQKIHTVIGHGAEQVKTGLGDIGVHWALQDKQLGTGHAVAQAMPKVGHDAVALILYGDVPLVKAATLQNLVDSVSETSMALLTVKLPNPSGYGRILRNNQGKVIAIVEQKDANAEQLLIDEVNTGILAVQAKKLNEWLPKLSSNNAQGEYYLTDIIGMAAKDNLHIVTHHPDHAMDVEGVNNRLQLNALERFYQRQKAEELMTNGATLADAARIDVRGNLKTGRDCFIDVNCIFEGDVELADNVTIGANCHIIDSKIGANTIIKANSVLEESIVAEHCDIGPFARLRPGTQLANKAKIGNFVETKKVFLGEGSKVNHLTYIGDAEIGKNVNVGAGTITCNYDGANKFKTILGDGVFIGSNSSLVAPVNIGAGATIGAGSVITGDVADNQLAVARGKQKNIDGWKRPVKQKK